MKRSGFKRNVPMVRSPWRSKPKSKRPGDNKAVRDACQGEPCYLRLPLATGCWPRNTVVPAHENQGKGMGLKVPDYRTVPACYGCHYEYDQGSKFTREEKRGFWNDAYQLWAPARELKLNR